MPIYEYRCENGHVFEVMRRMTDGPVTACEVCSAPVQQVFHPVAIHFKGKGFYNTDYGTKRKARELEKSASEGADKHDDKMASQKKEADKKASSDSKPKAEPKPKKKD
jgi:putative FmdB family regulatory protein